MLGAQKQKHKKQPFSDASASHLSLVLRYVWFQAEAWISHTTPLTPPSYEVGGIAKRIKTARLRRKTKPGRDVILHVRPYLWYYVEYQSFGADAKYRIPTMQKRFGRFDSAFFQEIILLSGVFRRETASGFYPCGKVDSPRKRVAEGLCGWRHGNSFPMTQSAQSHRQMRSIPHCSKAVFYVFVFDSIHDSATV